MKEGGELIFGLAGTAVMKAATENLTSVSQLQDITLATFVANNRLTQLHLEQEWPIRNNQKGEMEIAEVKWYWLQTVTKTQENDLVQVRISVAVDAEYQQMVTDVVSFFGKPSTSGGL